MTIPVHVVSGFLGAGKTTLLNGLLREAGMAHSVVLINEIGPVGIDHDLVLGASDDMLLLDGGCLCCQPRGSVADGISRLIAAAEHPPERLIVETSGTANPVPILETLAMTPALRERVHLARVLTVVDATSGAEALDRHAEARLQAACADHLAISKLDLARAGGQRPKLGPVLTGLNAAASRHALRADAPPAALVDALAADEGAPAALSLRPLPHGSEYHPQPFETVALEFDGDLEACHVQQWIDEVLDNYGHNLLRLKAILQLGGSERPAVLQCVRDVVHPIGFAEPHHDRGRNRVVAIGWDIHPDLLREALTDLAARARHQPD